MPFFTVRNSVDDEHNVRTYSRSDSRKLGGVDTKCQPRKDTISDIVTQKSILMKWVDSGITFFAENAVVCVGGYFLGVGIIRGSQLYGRNQVLIEESLADVARADVVAQSAIDI